MTKEDVLKKYSVYKGYDFFFPRCDDRDKLANAKQLKYLEEDYLGFKLPEKYRAFTNDYILGEEPYLFHLRLEEEESQFFDYVFKSSFDDDGNWVANYHHLLTFKGVYEKWGLFGKRLQEEYRWNLIQIEDVEYTWGSGLYLGFGPENTDKIYRIFPQDIPPDFAYNPSQRYREKYFKFVADDIFQFVESLRFNFDVGITDDYI